MRFKNLIIGCAIALPLVAAPAHATVTSSPIGTVTPAGGGVYTVDINWDNTQTTDVTVTISGAATDAVSYVHVISNSSGHRVNLIVEDVTSVGNVAQTSGAGELWITLIDTDSVGDVTANIIVQITAETGNISGAITEVASALASAEEGIHSLQALSGSISGDIASARKIGSIVASSGIIGVPGTPPTAISITMSSNAGLGDILAKSVYADIDLHSGGGSLNSLVTTGTGGSYTGEFSGSLDCHEITGAGFTYGLNVKGDLNADVTHAAVMATNFKIWGSLVGDISLPAAGLTRQITLNNDWPNNHT